MIHIHRHEGGGAWLQGHISPLLATVLKPLSLTSIDAFGVKQSKKGPWKSDITNNLKSNNLRYHFWVQRKYYTKGISPLLATVLLIAATVVTTTMLSGWVSTTMSTTQSTVGNKTSEGVACAAAEIVIDDVYSGAGSGSIARAIVRNSGGSDNLAITSAQLYDRIGHNFTSTSPLPISLNKGQMATINFTYPNFGMTANDSSIYGNNATLINGPIYAMNGKFDSALVLDGLNDWSNVTLGYFNASQGTVEMWIKPTWAAPRDSGGYEAFISLSHFDESISLNSSLLIEQHQEAGGKIGMWLTNRSGSNRWNGYATATWNANTWHHIAASWSSTGVAVDSITMYLDGINFTTQNLVGEMENFTRIYIGKFDAATRITFNGTVDDVAIWNRSLTNAEINTSMNYGPQSISNTNDLVGYWNFDEGRGVISCPSDFSRVVVTTSCGGVSTEFNKHPKC